MGARIRRNRRPGRGSRRPGFTAVEMIFVVLIAGVLTTLAMPPFRDYMHRREVLNARQSFAMAAARARAASVERGDVVVLMARIDRDAAFVMNADWTDTLEMIDYRDGEMKANILLASTTDPFRICYVPRGFVHPSCQDGGELPVRIGFTNRSGAVDTAWATINAVGQVEPE